MKKFCWQETVQSQEDVLCPCLTQRLCQKLMPTIQKRKSQTHTERLKWGKTPKKHNIFMYTHPKQNVPRWICTPNWMQSTELKELNVLHLKLNKFVQSPTYNILKAFVKRQRLKQTLNQENANKQHIWNHKLFKSKNLSVVWYIQGRFFKLSNICRTICAFLS